MRKVVFMAAHNETALRISHTHKNALGHAKKERVAKTDETSTYRWPKPNLSPSGVYTVRRIEYFAYLAQNSGVLHQHGGCNNEALDSLNHTELNLRLVDTQSEKLRVATARTVFLRNA